MNSYHSPLLKERVPYDWEELKRAAQELKNGPIPGQSEEQVTLPIAPQPEEPGMPNPEPIRRQEAAPVTPQARSQQQAGASGPVAAGLSEEELVARIVPKVLERLNSQIEIIVDVTLKTAATRIRSDLQKAVENTVRMTVKEELRKR
jgi:hypothetical protein